LPKNEQQIERHVAQWRHNRTLIGQIPQTHPDWVVTVSFYAAVHAVDAILAFEDVIVSNHEGRFKAMAALNRLLRVRTLYHPLYDLCRKVRYVADPNQWIPAAEIDAQVIRRYLLPLEKSVEKLLGRNLALSPIALAWSSTSKPVTPSGA
jgi:hypothetical protein